MVLLPIKNGMKWLFTAFSWLRGENNMSNKMTKKILCDEFLHHLKYLYWNPNWYLRNHNGLGQEY